MPTLRIKETEGGEAVSSLTFGKRQWKPCRVLTAVLLAVLVAVVLTVVTVLVLEKNKRDGTQTGVAPEQSGDTMFVPGESAHSFTAANGDYNASWEYDNDTITFGISARTLGWVGFGLSGTGGMAQADIMVAWVRGGQGYILDTHASQNGAPQVDSSQDWELLSATEEASITRLSVRRWLRLCDPNNRNITEGTMRLIWAMSTSDPASDSSLSASDYHGSTRGAVSRRVLGPVESIVMPTDLMTIDILHDKVRVPPKTTTYWCTVLVLPELSTKHHAVMVEPVVQYGHGNLVHHMLAYACTGTGDIEEDSYDCSTERRPEETTCGVSLLLAWAIGGTVQYMPANVGIPYGGPGSFRSVLLEIHYDNPMMKSGYVDSSGFRLWLTKQLRPHDSGVMTIGMLLGPLQMIPPGKDNFISVAHCSSSCLDKVVSQHPDGLHVYGVVLHTHLAGHVVRVRHVRGDNELKPIDEDLSYDFNYQNMRMLEEEVTILPGDRIVVECGYNTSSRVNITWGGQATTDEMCLAFLFYYPKSSLTGCHSAPTMPRLATLVPGSEVVFDPQTWNWFFTAPGDLAGQPVIRVIAEYLYYPEGSPKRDIADGLQEVVKDGDIMEFCGAEENSFYELTVPEVVNPYVEPLPKDCK